MNKIEQAREEGRGYYTSMKDPDHNFAGRALNVRVAIIPVGAKGDQQAPLAAIVWVNAGPGDILRGRHTHPSDAINLVVEGSMYMDGVWLRPGQAKIVPAETNYGDAVTPTGVLFLEIFADHAGGRPAYVDPDARAYFTEVHGEVHGQLMD